MAEYIAAIDQSTDYTQCVIFDHATGVVAEHTLKHRQSHPEAGWLEHYPLEIWANTHVAFNSAVQKAGIRPAQIAAIGIANQRETTVVWNRYTGKPYNNAIVWRDLRTDEICHQLMKEGGQNRFREKTGLPISFYFSAPKLRWLIENIPGLEEAAQAGEAVFGNLDSWLIWNFTGGVNNGLHVTDVTNASRTMLMNLTTLQWDEELCRIFKVPRQMLPAICSSSHPTGFGKTAPAGPIEAGIPITGILGSQQAAAVGQACFNAGDVKNSYDGASFIIINTGEKIVPSRHGLLTTVGYQFYQKPPVYALEGSIACTGLLVEWLRDNLKLIEDFNEVEALAQTVEDNGGVYLVPAFKGLFAPYWRSDARGVIAGLTGFANRGHIARAALEAIAYQTRDVLDAMQTDMGGQFNALKADGYMTRNELLMQFQADVLGIPVIKPKVIETTALGAAYAAGLAAGFWPGITGIQQRWEVDRVWHPTLHAPARTVLYNQWKVAVNSTLNWTGE